jgi:hypothetical protein
MANPRLRGSALAKSSRTFGQSYPLQTSVVTNRLDAGVTRANFDTGNVDMRPGDPSYSPTDMVEQKPGAYPTTRPVVSIMQKGPGQSPGWWATQVPGRHLNPSQYVDQNVGGQSGDTKRMDLSSGILPFTTFRQPFTGAVLTPPRPRVMVVGSVGRLGFRDGLELRVRAATTDYQPSAQAVTNAMINPQLGW